MTTHLGRGIKFEGGDVSPLRRRDELGSQAWIWSTLSPLAILGGYIRFPVYSQEQATSPKDQTRKRFGGRRRMGVHLVPRNHRPRMVIHNAIGQRVEGVPDKNAKHSIPHVIVLPCRGLSISTTAVRTLDGRWVKEVKAIERDSTWAAESVFEYYIQRARPRQFFWLG
jgi:hypothetical protein